ncbi:GAF domain-containing protein [candidate division KSB1 bacterium]|nr:GAF domain-containing protein [candidate division KSB1 bacterium]
MQREPQTILFLSDRLLPEIQDVISAFNGHVSFKALENQDELLDYITRRQPAIVLVDSQYVDWTRDIIQKFAADNSVNQWPLLLLTDHEVNGQYGDVFDIIDVPINKSRFTRSLQHASQHVLMLNEINKLQKKLTLQTQELHELNNIGIALSAERDPDSLLELILHKSREITHADAGSLYLVEKRSGVAYDQQNYFADKQLRFKLAHCDSVDVGFTEFVMPIQSHSIAGHVALSGQVLNIPDVYELTENSGFSHNRSFDESIGYRSKSMLVIPMKTHKDEIIGVLQLINRKRHWDAIIDTIESNEREVIAFDEKCTDLASSLASQAAVSIENNRLYEDIRTLFEGFIKASVHAIEQRDPTTSGHSERVAVLTTELAKTVDKLDSGPFERINFSRDAIQQINYASLLHDFGKIGVREDVLVKAKKLYPYELERIRHRFHIFLQANELDFAKQKITQLLNIERDKALSIIAALDMDMQKDKDELDRFLEHIVDANEPTILDQAGSAVIEKLGTIYRKVNGSTEPILTPDEIRRLAIPKGSLSDKERNEIESHVTHTFNFLSRIPWTSELKDVPNIAYAHHEKLDGTGYPRRLDAPNIPIQSRMMTIADIYDALTAQDRPYKRAVPEQKALDILGYEMKAGKIDADLFNLFVDAKIYEAVRRKVE